MLQYPLRATGNRLAAERDVTLRETRTESFRALQGRILSIMHPSLYSRPDEGGASPPQSPLVDLGRWLAGAGYQFVTVTPATHARVNARPASLEAHSVEDVFGWNRPFSESLLPGAVLQMLRQADAVAVRDGMLVSRVRFATLNDRIYVHSAFPTREPDAVFFGPDTYRFATLIRRALAADPMPAGGVMVDMGCGAGAGGIVAAGATAAASSLILADINPAALRYARINAALAGVGARFQCGDLFSGVAGPVDLIVANPPYMVDPQARLYRDGGGALGSALSMRIVREGLACLAPAGRLILYTGSPIVRGKDLLKEAIEMAIAGTGVSCAYAELDPDVFGEELEMPAYHDVDRIAAVGAILTVRAPAALQVVATFNGLIQDLK